MLQCITEEICKKIKKNDTAALLVMKQRRLTLVHRHYTTMSSRGKGGNIKGKLTNLLPASPNDGKMNRQKTKRQKVKKDVQCFRCQKFGHVAKKCKGSVACLKCAEAHDTRDCTKPREASKKCANCGGAHAANFRRCSYVRDRRASKKRDSGKLSRKGRGRKLLGVRTVALPHHKREGSKTNRGAERTTEANKFQEAMATALAASLQVGTFLLLCSFFTLR